MKTPQRKCAYCGPMPEGAVVVLYCRRKLCLECIEEYRSLHCLGLPESVKKYYNDKWKVPND